MTFKAIVNSNAATIITPKQPTSLFSDKLSYGKASVIDWGTPSWLYDELYKVFGASMIGLYVGEDIIYDSSNNVTSWPGRIGGTLTNISVNRFQLVKSPRFCISATDPTTQKGLQCLGTGIKSVISVAEINSLPANATQYLISSTAVNEILAVSGTTSVWFSGGATFYKDGVNTNVLSLNNHIYEATTNSTWSNIVLGGLTIATVPWRGKISLILELTSIPTASQRISYVNILNTYYGM